ncbi:MAG: STAS domain-containing protein [Bacteroidales bacterium]|nr:STAS domain-containing protein [Bacteroidales bacterium]
MTTSIQQENGELVARLEGRLDTAVSAQTEKDLQPLNECQNMNIVLDCNKLEYISSSGLRIFLNILKNAKAKGGRVIITGMNADINKVFTMTGFTNLFEFR